MKIKYLNNASDCYQSWSEGKDFIESIEEKEVNLIQTLDLETFKTKLEKIIKQLEGKKIGKNEKNREFDSKTLKIMMEYMPITRQISSDHRFWSYLSFCVLRDITQWRFGAEEMTANQRRFLGGAKDMFRRLWRRIEALDLDITQDAEDLKIAGKFGEEAWVNITERLISVNTDFIRETLKLWAKEKYTQPDMRAFMKFSRSLLPVREIGEMGGMTKDFVKEVSEFIKSDSGKYLYPQ
tara:strand:+ start:17308 stop:18021 length:714 start_codon:yes stop_codon:yes gene_type:complete